MNDTQKYRETCAAITIGVFLIYVFFIQNPILLSIVVIIGISGLFIPLLRKWIHIFWMQLAQVMGWIVSKILLTIIFFTFLTPIAIIKRLFSKNSYNHEGWQPRNHAFNIKDLKKIW
ncbi:MAG TPA: SxtJ family membrane protein [Bacteroidales bacterium]|jgi:energy-coupling factor transporter transmembrane protein EcfT|nr:SxtJ family membrane protein [Bacteroidales bacterium]MDD4236345.1 SxtJ family membrane protein [Bacteroidales bacterium]MDY0160871.1 SxtJ family membrane protein [Bacteroidales bacterium]HRW20890.1 SxtJ family membrane protein [Bacteroidales bacterium]HXK82112.1 SxtJ family membrane protein [Bacteroidales bacterium]